MAKLIALDELPHEPHSHEFVAGDYGDVPFSVILVHAGPGAVDQCDLVGIPAYLFTVTRRGFCLSARLCITTPFAVTSCPRFVLNGARPLE